MIRSMFHVRLFAHRFSFRCRVRLVALSEFCELTQFNIYFFFVHFLQTIFSYYHSVIRFIIFCFFVFFFLIRLPVYLHACELIAIAWAFRLTSKMIEIEWWICFSTSCCASSSALFFCRLFLRISSDFSPLTFSLANLEHVCVRIFFWWFESLHFIRYLCCLSTNVTASNILYLLFCFLNIVNCQLS